MKRAGRSPSSARKQFLCHFGGSRGSSAALAVQICGLRPEHDGSAFCGVFLQATTRDRGIGEVTELSVKGPHEVVRLVEIIN